MKDEEKRMKPVLKSRAFFLMNELVLGNEEARKDADPQVDILIRRRPGKIQEIQKGRHDSKGVERMPVALPTLESPLFVNDEFIDEHDEALEDKG